MVQTLIIDNYDSYTFNLYQLIAEVNGSLPLVIYNNQMDWESVKQLAFDNIVISPGPGRPENATDFGICGLALKNSPVPVLGVCLGHQGLGHVYGGKIIHAPEVRHGRLSWIYHDRQGLFKGIPNPFSVVRYHSLLVADDLPDCLQKTAWTEDGLIMGLRHRQLPLWGVQFHPESISTEYGRVILENFRDLTREVGIHSARTFKQQQEKRIKPISLPTATINKKKQDFTLFSQQIDNYPDSEQLFYNLFADSDHAFWLDSSRVEAGLSRFSFMGDNQGKNGRLVHYHVQSQELTVTKAGKVSRHRESIFEYLKRELAFRQCLSENLPFDFNCGFVGYLGYELKAESGSELVHRSPFPDAMFLLADRLIVIDHQEKTLYLLCLVQTGQKQEAEAWFTEIQAKLKNLSPLPEIIGDRHQDPVVFRLSRSPQLYRENIAQCLQEIHEGETYQVCLTNQLKTETTPDPFAFYRTLRRINPAPYAAFLKFGEIAIASSSPERFLKIDAQGWVETKPIKGTLHRDNNAEKDLILRERLRKSEKDRAENLMIVDLLRNDLGKVCQIGTVHVPKLMEIETYATVHQLVSTIGGHLLPDLPAVECVRAAWPGGSMTGAPKIRTLQIIDRLEQEARGIYSGSIGFFGLNGSVDLNIVIRTAILTPQETSIGVGGGIVAMSDPTAECQEILLKAQALIQAIVLTVNGSCGPDNYQILGVD
jgi:para-aminobenzoate synthetase